MTSLRSTPRYLAIGALIYAVAAAIWFTIAVAQSGSGNPLMFALFAVSWLALVVTAVVRLRALVDLPGDQSRSAEIGKTIGLIFSAEGIAIGVGCGILVALNRAEWIAHWTAIVVGLHFVPLGYVLRLKFDYVLAPASILLVAVAAVAATPTSQPIWIALGMALLLWLAGWGRLWVARRDVMVVQS